MINTVSGARPRLALRPLLLAALIATPAFIHAQSTLEKVADFQNVIRNGVYDGGSSGAYDNAIQIGNRLWFTTNTGGGPGFGTISYYDLTTRQITAVASLNNTTGRTPQSSLTQVGNNLYFTTTLGGTGGTGTLSYFDVTSVTAANPTATINVAYNFGAATTDTNPRTPGGSVTPVVRANGSTDLYFTTANGGTGGAAYGTISKYNTATGTVSTVFNFTGGSGATATGRQPMEGFTSVGGKLYFTTFTGGSNTASPGNNNTGTLGVLDPATDTVQTLASMPIPSGQFPTHNVTQAANGMLYFTTVGNATNPGSIQSYNIATGTLSTVYSLTGAATSSGPFPDGRFAYGSILERDGVLYFATMAGGTYGFGAIDAFDLNSNRFIKLFDLDGGTATNLQKLGQGTRGGFTLVNENGQDYLYLLTNGGGAYNNGTILRITPVPEPGTIALLAVAGVGGWLVRRRRKRSGQGTSATEKRPHAPPLPGLPRAGCRGFTLLEITIVIGIIAVLSAILVPSLSAARDKGKEITCIGNLRQIGSAYQGYSQDHNGWFPTGEVIGYSNFRSANDPYGLPVLFIPYLGQEMKNGKPWGVAKLWLCPGGRPSLKEFGTNYAWTRSQDTTLQPAFAVGSKTPLAWDNFTMTLPSTYNVPESATTGGPTAPSAQYRYYAHRNRTKANYVFVDGHTEIR